MLIRFMKSALALMVSVLFVGSTACTFYEKDEPGFIISEELLGRYSIIRGENADEKVISAASDLYDELFRINSDVSIKDDFFREDLPEFAPGEYEILVGDTNRPESDEFILSFRGRDYGYALVGTKLVIRGATDEGTLLALEEFRNNILDSARENNEYFYSSKEDHIFKMEYILDELIIGNVPIQEFRIVYPAEDIHGESIIAGILRERLADTIGYMPEIVTDDTMSDNTPEICIGETNRYAHSGYGVRLDGFNLYFNGNNHAELSCAVESFMKVIRSTDTRIFTYDLADLAEPCESTLYSAMSYNIYCGDMTEKRIESVLTMIKSYLPDTFGVQEATPEWMGILEKHLGDIYAFVGEGRDGNDKGEYSAIAFKKDRFELIEEDTFWLSDTPDSVSKYKESSLNRIATYARLKCKDGKQILVVNTHFDHVSDEARNKQVQVLMDFMKKYTDIPIILTGDFNAGTNTKVYQTIIDSGLENTACLSLYGKNIGTFRSGATIDFIFTNSELIRVLGYKVANNTIDGAYPSDHFPVFIKYALK